MRDRQFNGGRATVFTREAAAHCDRSDTFSGAASASTNSYASLVLTDSVRTVMSTVSEQPAKDRAKVIRDAKLPTMMELQRAELRERGLPLTASLDRFPCNIPRSVCEPLRDLVRTLTSIAMIKWSMLHDCQIIVISV